MGIFEKLNKVCMDFNRYANEIKSKFEPVDTTPKRTIGNFEYIVGSLRADYKEGTSDNEGKPPFTLEDLSREVGELDRATAPNIPNMSVITLPYKQIQQEADRELKQNLYKDLGFAKELYRQWSGGPEVVPVVV